VDRERLPRVVVFTWALFGLVAVVVAVTYARVDPVQLYHVHRGGLAGGLSRGLVFLNFPAALVAVAIAGIAVDRLRDSAADMVGLATVILCAVVALPGVVDQANLDASAVNAVPAAGVALALFLTVWLGLRGLERVPRLRLDRGRVVLAVAVLLVGIPWLVAELGFSVSDLPLLGDIFLGKELRPVPGDEAVIAVHRGHHHGADGLYLTLAALLLSRALPLLGRPLLRAAVSFYVALMLAYGLAQVLQDAWTEQVLKRGWTHHRIPALLHPSLSLGWLAILAAAVLVEVAWRRERTATRATT